MLLLNVLLFKNYYNFGILKKNNQLQNHETNYR